MFPDKYTGFTTWTGSDHDKTKSFFGYQPTTFDPGYNLAMVCQIPLGKIRICKSYAFWIAPIHTTEQERH